MKRRCDGRFRSGQYCRVDPARRLSFTWTWEPPHGDMRETQVTLDFHARGDATHLVLVHERFRDEPLRDLHEQGWRGCLNRLARMLGP